MAMKNREIKIKIRRFNPDADPEPYLEEYPVDYYEGMRIWRALDHINEKQGAGIARRLSCREYLCGSCTIMINGRPGLACKTASLSACGEGPAVPIVGRAVNSSCAIR